MAKGSSIRQYLVGWRRELGPILLSLFLVLMVRTVVAEPYSVPTPSMVPTLMVGDELIASKFAYGYSKYSAPLGHLPGLSGRLFDRVPDRGDVVVFRLPRDPSITYVKRLIGLPGDRIQVREGRLYINDVLVPRRAVGPFDTELAGRGVPSTLYVETLPNGREHKIVEMSDTDHLDNTPVFVVPPKHYFMMGDNRDNSLDSRVAADEGGVGFVPEENLVARADLLLMSRDPAVSWFDVARWPQAFHFDRALDRVQ